MSGSNIVGAPTQPPVMGRLFQCFAGMVKQYAMVNGQSLPAETPCLVMGMFVSNSQPQLIIMLQGGALQTVTLTDVIVDLTDEMKKALAEVVLKS